jgi:hypothetical protein
LVYDKANSTLSNSLNSVAYFQTANVDSLVSSGNVTGGNILTAGLISVTGNVSGNFFIGNGSQLTGITASANTGNVTFNDQAVVGTGNPEGGGGLYLAPGTESVGNLQYIRVRGGDVATHIHLDTGNNAYFDQYFGDDSKYVKLEAAGNIQIGSNDNTGNSAQWTFGIDGNLTLPLGSIVYETNIPDQSLSGSAIALKPIGGTTANQKLLIYPTANDGDHIHMTSGNLYATELFLGSDNLYVKLANTGNVVINSNDAVGNSAQWTFGADGDLTIPGGAKIADNSSSGIQLIAGAGGTVRLASNNDAYFWIFKETGETQLPLTSVDGYEGGHLTALGNVIVNANDNFWKFGQTGQLTVPGAILTSSASKLDLVGFGPNTAYLTTTADDSTALFMGAAGVDLRASETISIATNTDDITYTWTFDAEGNLTLPGNLTTSSNIKANYFLGNFVGNISGNINSNVNGFAIGYRDIPQVVFTSNSTLALTDAGKHYYSANSANVITIPNNTTVSFNIGTAISIVQQGTANLTVTPGSGVTLYLAGNSTSASRTLGNFGMATLMKVGTDTWFINGTGVN